MIEAATENCGSQLFRLTHQLVFLLCALCVVPSATQDGKITCSVPSVYPYQETVLMCHFPEDVMVSKKDFTVYYYAPRGSAEAVLDCWWVRGYLDCYTKTGFKYNKKVGRNLNLTFSEVTRAHEGIYACQVAGYGSSFLEICELNLRIGENNTCNISQEQSNSQASLKCFFNENIHKTQREFIVYKHTGQEKRSVVKCLWDNGLQRCQTEEGYQYNMDVSSYLKMTIPKPRQAEADTYSCWHNGSQADRVKTCSIDGIAASDEEKNYTTVILVLVIVPAVLALSIFVWFLLYKRRRRSGSFRFRGGDREMDPMIERKNEVTEKFKKGLLQDVGKMYPNMLDGCYFVPPVYFNKLRYTTQSVVGQVIYIPDTPDDSNVRHDRAMKHVLHCLHHMAEHGQEKMFVLTQFNYNDYLNNPGEEYRKHLLPVFDSLKNKNKDKHVGCFDVMIIHQQYGVVIGVVKSLSDKDDGRKESEQETDHQLAKDISEGIQQLVKADRVIQHFMSDQQQCPPVQLTLMLPNVTRSTLQRALNNHADVAKNLCECMKTMEPPTELCLCADDVSNPVSPWDVDPTVISHLTKWWGRLMSSPADGPAMRDELYQTMIARFCGGATSSGSDILRGSKINQLPKTLEQSVSVTGDLFERLTLYPGMVELLDRPRVLLTGPPATGKSRMLVLVGRKWISEGHSVYIINTSTEGGAATIQLETLLQQTPTTEKNSAKDMVIRFYCNIEENEKTDVAITSLIADASARKIPIFAVLDELGNNLGKSKQGTAFLQKLLQLPDLHLWAATSCSDVLPDDCYGRNLTETLSCPPSVVREAKKYDIPGMSLYTDSNRQAPTDGLPVKNIHHHGHGHQHKEPRDCSACGEAIVQFLKACVHDKDGCDITKKINPTNDQAPLRQPPFVQWKDILIIFEKQFTEDMTLMKSLLDSKIPLQIISYENQEKILTSDNNTVLAAKAGFLCGLKRKVVVYVEGSIKLLDDSAKWNRFRGITSCTSQLVVIRMS